MNRAGFLALVSLLSIHLTSALRAQPSSPVNLSAPQLKFSRLAPGLLSGQAVFAIEQCTRVQVEIIASGPLVSTSILGPSGQVLNPGTIGGLGGAYNTLQGSQPASMGPVYLPNASPGHHYIYSFPWLGAGNYTVNFAAGASLSDDLAVISQVTTDSRIAVNLFVTEPFIIVGNPAVLVAAVFNGGQAVAGAAVNVSAVPPTGPAVSVVLRDDGQDADSAAGDGLYSGQVIPTQVGLYNAAAVVTGTTSGGVAFTRNPAVPFDVISPGSKLTGAFNDNGVDSNSDGLFERVEIRFAAETTRPGNYQLFIQLKTALGKTLLRSNPANLAAGAGGITVPFEAAAFLSLGENGPYQIEQVNLVSLLNQGAQLNDRRLNVGQTKAYLLSQFQQPPLALTGVVTDQGIDTNSNGKFDFLRVSVQTNVRTAGFYRWSYRLTDLNRREIAFLEASGALAAGLNNLTINFPGTSISRAGFNGPYLIRDMLVLGPASLAAVDVGSTNNYLASQFEGAVIAGDVNGDGVVDCADIALVRSLVGKRAGQPGFDPRADVNKDNVIDVRDVAYVSQRLAPGTRCQ